MKEIITTSIFILLFSTFGIAQMPVSELSKKTHLEQLKKGVLLVQLPNSDKKIEILRKKGLEKLAKTEEKEINKIRKNIIDGFQKDWNFSDILFFESTNAKEAFLKNPEVLLGADLKSLKKFPNYENLYSVRYGRGNPNGEVYRYNGIGFQIRYVDNGSLQTIKYDTFYHWKTGLGIKMFFKNIGKDDITKIPQQISQFNSKLEKLRF